MKKSLLTLIMALVMALACATSAFAEDLGYPEETAGVFYQAPAADGGAQSPGAAALQRAHGVLRAGELS